MLSREAGDKKKERGRHSKSELVVVRLNPRSGGVIKRRREKKEARELFRRKGKNITRENEEELREALREIIRHSIRMNAARLFRDINVDRPPPNN